MKIFWADKFADDIESVIPELENGNFIGNRLEGLKLPEGTATYN